MTAIATAHQSYTRAFNRYEIKYVLHYEQAARLLEMIDPFIEVDRYAGAHGHYRIVSLYYDSPQLVAFWEKIDGVKFRRKLRVRRYDADTDGRAYLEIKQRIDRTVQKRRVAGEAGEIIAWLGGATDDGDFDDPVYQEAQWLAHTQRLKPQVITSYTREAYFGKYERGLRVTLDKNIRWRPFRGPLRCSPGSDRFILPPHQFVLEVKCNDMIPGWLCSCLNHLNLQIDRFSKYCGAINHHVYGGTML